MAEKTTADIGFEKQIWDAACVLRGNMDASEYKNVVLGLIFLKYISDRFEEKHRELVAEGDGFAEDIDEYTSEGIFFVPQGARWGDIAAKAHTPEIGTAIDEAMRAIEKDNKRLKDILPKNFARPELDKRRLGEVVDLFTNIRMIEHGDEKDILGRTYEYCLSKFAEQEGKLAGEFYTPSCVVRTLVEVLQPYHGRVYDPCCGSGGMFVQSAKFVESHSGNINDISVYGQDSNPTTWKMAQMNLAIRGIDADLGKFNADTFFNDCHPTLRADFIMANPPFGVEWKTDKPFVEKELTQPNNRFVAGTPRVSDGQLLFLQNLISKAEDDARIAIILNGSPLFSGDAGSGESEIRRYVLENHLLEAIVALPDQMFYNTGIYTYVWILSKKPSAKRNHKVQLIDATSYYVPQTPKSLGNKRKFIDDTSIGKIVDAYKAFNESEISKLFDAADFGYTKVTIECPLYNEKGEKVVKRGVVQVDTARRDTETIPLKTDIDEYIKDEVLPYVPDAFADRSKDKIGYEIPFTRYFYKYTPPRKSDEILAEIAENEASVQETLRKVIG